MFECPRCSEGLVIETARETDPDDLVEPSQFIKLPFEISSTARWSCGSHGPIAPVVVAVVDGHIEFVPPEGLR